MSLDNMLKKLSVRSPWLFRINAGSCNGCDVELATTACIPRYDVERLGCRYCGSPRHADIVLITGPLTTRVRDRVLAVWNEIPEPKITVAVGICPISGGVFREGYSIEGPISRYIPVDVNVPGCPPRPRPSWKAWCWHARCGSKSWASRNKWTGGSLCIGWPSGWGCVTPHPPTVPPPLPRQHPGISPAGVAASATTSAV